MYKTAETKRNSQPFSEASHYCGEIISFVRNVCFSNISHERVNIHIYVEKECLVVVPVSRADKDFPLSLPSDITQACVFTKPTIKGCVKMLCKCVSRNSF